MPIRSFKCDYLFLMAPGTASSAVAEGVLIPSLEGAYFPAEHILDDAGMILLDKKHGTVSELKRAGLISDDEADAVFKFTTVRNPFDLLVTRYFHLRTRMSRHLSKNPASMVHKLPGISHAVEVACSSPTFSDWLEQLYLIHHIRNRIRRPFARFVRPQHLYRRYTKDADFVMRFEHLQSDFDEVTMRLGISERLVIPRLNATAERNADYRLYYTPRARKIVEAVFRPELERFGYEF